MLTRLKYLLWWCAGADVAALKACPTDHAKYTAMGMMMLVVPCVALVSFNFFVRQSFGAQTMAAMRKSISSPTARLRLAGSVEAQPRQSGRSSRQACHD